MNFPFYTNHTLEDCRKSPLPVPSAPSVIQTIRHFQPDNAYLPDKGLVDAVNTALLLGQPLLLTGEPGTGKTQLAYHLACQLGYPVLKFETKSTLTARDLFYTYDSLERFRDIQLKEQQKRAQDYVTYHALGLAIILAIILANTESEVASILPFDFEETVRKILGEEADLTKPQRCIVLIDEIDKAPRDFPNDILNEVEKCYFRIPELGKLGSDIIQAPTHLRPILILTSNGEKNLPDTFLRRCIYYNIPFPELSRLREIVELRLAKYSEIKNFVDDALELFFKLREVGLRKKPSTAELLNWLLILQETFKPGTHPLVQYADHLPRTFSTLVKTADDQKTAEAVLKQWQTETRR